MSRLGIRLIRSMRPAWFAVSNETDQEMVGTATIEIPDASKDFVIEVKISSSGDAVLAYEAVIGTRLPAACPERHINADGSFCLNLDAPTYATDRDRAAVWWSLLHNFLRLQHAASRSRSWPPRQALSHGDAGKHHLNALDVARELGIEEDYYRMLEGEAHWFSNPFLRVDRSARRLCNGRLPCPKGCMSRNGTPILRRNCDRKELISALAFHEAQRRKAEENFWKAWIEEGRKCCETMNRCPLRDAFARTRAAKLRKRAHR